jgi:K+-transporting ATPase ATPase C chain
MSLRRTSDWACSLHKARKDAVARIAKACGLSEGQMRELVLQNTEGPDFAFLGEPGVNVLRLNLALGKL